MRVEVPGQENVAVALGGAGDKTVTVAIGSNHVNLHNLDPVQHLMYSTAAAPVFPAGWKMLGPGLDTKVWMNAGVALHLRKKWLIRGDRVESTVLNDVPLSVDYEEINY